MLWPGCHCPHSNPVSPGQQLRPSGWYPVSISDPMGCREHRTAWVTMENMAEGAAEAWAAGGSLSFTKALA